MDRKVDGVLTRLASHGVCLIEPRKADVQAFEAPARQQVSLDALRCAAASS